MSRVVDASVVVSAVADDVVGSWAREQLGEHTLLAPHLLPVEVASSLRRLATGGRIPGPAAEAALADALDLGIDLVPFEPFASRVWQLRDTLTPYDAWYVAVAEAFDVPLATLDARLVRATGPRCTFLTPP